MTTGKISASLEREQSVPLSPLLGARWVFGKSTVASVSLLSLCWLWFSYLPLSNGALWSQLSSVEHFPLLEGVPGHAHRFAVSRLVEPIVSKFGLEGIAVFQTLCAMTAALLLCLACYQIHGRLLLATVSIAVMSGSLSLVTGTLQSSVTGFLSSSLLLLIAANLHQPCSRGLVCLKLAAIALTMAVWVNSDSSFIVGILILLSLCLGTGMRSLQGSRSLRSLVSDLRFRLSVIALEAGILGLLCNPEGMNVLLHAKYLNWFLSPYAARSWHALSFDSPAGLFVGLTLLGLFGLFRFSRERLNAGLVPAWIVLGALTWLDQSALIWWFPLTILLIQSLLAERLSLSWPKHPDRFEKNSRELTAANFRLTLLSLLPIWFAFSFSPLGSSLLGGKPRDLAHVVSRNVPLALTAHLREVPPLGQVIHPAHWGDWLSFAGPKDLELFLAVDDVERCPRTLYRDQADILTAAEDWEKTANKYRINTIIIEREGQLEAIRKFDRASEWGKSYEDEETIVYRRKVTKTIPPSTGDSV